MKTKRILRKLTAALWLCALIPASSYAQSPYLLGGFQNNSGDGWIDWSTGDSVTNTAVSATYSLVQNAVPGYPQSLQIGKGGYNQTLAIKLETIPGGIAAFTNNNQINFVFSVPASTSTSGYSQVAQLVVNTVGTGFQQIPQNTNTWKETGSTGNDSASGQPNYYWGPAGSVRSQTVTVDYSSLLPMIVTNTSYIQLVFTFNNGGGAPTNFFINQVTLSDNAGQIVYTHDDFATNGVGPTNPTNDDWFATAEDYSVSNNIDNVWFKWYGNGVTNIYFAPDVNVGNGSESITDHGAMAIEFYWDAATDGYQQWLVWHNNSADNTPVPGGNVSIGYPQYTNLECDVKFDATSAGTTNSAGVLGVIRVGVEPPGSYASDWIGTSYTTISDTNWHHINAALNNSVAAYANVGSVLIGEDVSGYVGGGGLTGYQRLYVDNIRFTGPAIAPLIPPPSVHITPATPGARLFTTSPQYTRTWLSSADQNQSWIGGPGDSGNISTPYPQPVEYTFTLNSLTKDPSAQTTIWLVDGAANNYNQYDYGAGSELWMNINYNTGLQAWTAVVAWKANDTGANPTNTALTITNTIGVGKWTLAFTGETNGYLLAPGMTSGAPFTVSDPNVATDFVNPLVAHFGIEGNGSSYGSYNDYAQVTTTNVAGQNIYDVFADDPTNFDGNTNWDMGASDIYGGSGYYQVTNSTASYTSTYPATTRAMFQVTTNTPYWISWNVTTNGYGLAETINGTVNLARTNICSPQFLSGYNALQYQAVAGGTNWALIPKQNLPPNSEATFLIVNPPPFSQ